ncbi:porin family protein [Rhodobacter sp. Har01]|uniref:outer membrane protein n=1 Tax=Rhodobacter sp. Har01 TaxID=2883999 RepID=UPI001D05DA80|nr:outer membrane beta-barrel protein [Rhodobacter sp. Har01]MCB6177300.1 porin family protein [Rhodobacter sp. Har01]
MVRLMVSMAALAASASLAMAGGPLVVPADPVVVAPVAVHDWSGPYVGLSYGKTSADVTFSPGPSFDFEDGSIAAIQVGYLYQRGALVYGGELAYGKLSDTFIAGFGGDDEIEYTVDLKARLGYAMNKSLVYGVLGYSKSNYVEPPNDDWKADGIAYGLGAEFAVSQQFTLGLEYLTRDTSGDNPDGLGQTADFGLDTISLRLNFAF